MLQKTNSFVIAGSNFITLNLKQEREFYYFIGEGGENPKIDIGEV